MASAVEAVGADRNGEVPGAANGWTSGVWATYRGWQRHDAQVRRGESGTHVESGDLPLVVLAEEEEEEEEA